ncbi:MAG: T9SS type A sorting domain-containing protein [Chitinophagaceae bacterium]|nr:T9SS type A sorting domain-containing protein [Chitinophagaceae bacterium]
MKRIFLTLISLFACLHSFTQIVSIPDANFKAALLANPLVNTNFDTEIQVSEAVAFNGILSFSYNSISDLTGIAAFVNLTGLICIGNQITSLDLSSNLALTSLDCPGNQLTNLNISANTALSKLYCSQNQLTSLDVSANTALTVLICNMNQISSLDVSSNTALTHLNCMVNQITSLNLNNHAALKFLYCNNNQLNTLNLNGATALEYLQCSNNDDYTFLNLSGLANLSTMNCINSPSLQCIQVSNVAAANANSNWTKDATVAYSLNCPTALSNTESDLFDIYPIPANDKLTITGIEDGDQLKIFNIFGQVVVKEVNLNEHFKTIGIESLSDGFYTIQVIRNQREYIKKFVKDTF